jgi:EpsI family protein
MFVASVSAVEFHPNHRVAEDGTKVNLETMIPKKFGEWQETQQLSAHIINPQQKENLERIYSQTLTRTYVNVEGDSIMMSIAYGENQSDAKQLHYPEVCYPAQGFQVISSQIDTVKTDFGDIRVKRLLTVMANRSEPLTYWTTVGTKVVVGSKETKFEQLRYGFRGEVPDGFLFRVSTITQDMNRGFTLQQKFIQMLMAALTASNRLKLAGLTDISVIH